MLSARCTVDPPLCYTIQTSRRFRVSILSNPIWATTNFHVEIRCTVRSRSQKELVSRSEFCLVTTSEPGAWRWRCVGAALRRTRSKGQSGVNVTSKATRLVNSSGDVLRPFSRNQHQHQQRSGRPVHFRPRPLEASENQIASFVRLTRRRQQCVQCSNRKR